MPPKRATFITYGDDAQCAEVRKFIEGAGVVLDIRDIEKQRLSVDEIDRLISYFDIHHFLNPLSQSFEKHGFDRKLPPRDEIISLIDKDHTLLRRPIVRTNRLFTVGCDRKKISIMLQISLNGRSPADEDKENGQSQPQAVGTTK